MFREDLDEDRGMLFDFGEPQQATCGCATPTCRSTCCSSTAWPHPQIAADVQPLSDAVIASREPVRAVLELRGGVSANLGIKPGDRVIHPLFEAP